MTTKINPYSTLPIIAITLFFAYWFDAYSSFEKFHYIFILFSGDLFTHNFVVFDKLAGLFTLVGLGIILWPRKDSSNLKWGLLAAVAFLLFILENGDDFPHVANHDMMMTFLSMGFLIIALSYLVKGQFIQIFTNLDYLPLMRASLVIMYLFGTFHKINTSFLHVDGCWRIFYDTIPFMPQFLLDPKIGLILGGYGTLVLEAVAMVMLFFPKTKYYGMLIGMAFHFIIGVAGTGTVAHFSGLAFALHMSFLSKDAPAQFFKSKFWLDINDTGKGMLYLRIPFVLCLLITILFSFVYMDIVDDVMRNELNIGYAYIKTMWWLFAVPIWLFVILYGRTPEERPKDFMISKIWLANIATVFLFVNSITAYTGIKSNADLGMFSNMRTEWNQTNHYIVRKPWALFPYLNKEYYVQVLDTSHPKLNHFRKFMPKDMIKTSPKLKMNEQLWIHKFTIHKEFWLNRSNKDGEKYWIEYLDSDGKKQRYDGTQENHMFFSEPNWWVKHYLVYTNFVDIDPRICSSR